MPARINPTARLTPGSKVRVIEIARKFFSPLPAATEHFVKEAHLRADGWYVVFEGYLDEYPEAAFEVVKSAELGFERELPKAFYEELDRLTSQFQVPPGYESIVVDDERFRTA